MRVVLLHSLPLDATMWANAGELGIDAPIAPTLYAFGSTLEEWAQAVVDLAGPEPFIVVGNSVGGSCALEVARLVPERVHAIVLIGAKASHRAEPEVRDEAIRVLRDGGMAAAWPRYWAPGFGRQASVATIERARSIAENQDVDDVIRGVDVFHGRDDRTDFARRWPKPLAVISGDQDRTPAPATGAELAASVPHGEFHQVADCGHYVSLEQPDRLSAILARVFGGDADTVQRSASDS